MSMDDYCLLSNIFTARVSGLGNRIGLVCLSVCLSGFVRATLCISSMVQDYGVHSIFRSLFVGHSPDKFREGRACMRGTQEVREHSRDLSSYPWIVGFLKRPQILTANRGTWRIESKYLKKSNEKFNDRMSHDLAYKLLATIKKDKMKL